MYQIIQIDTNKVRVFLHEDCEFDIHYASREVMHLDHDATGAEYSVQSDETSIVAFFYD